MDSSYIYDGSLNHECWLHIGKSLNISTDITCKWLHDDNDIVAAHCKCVAQPLIYN